MLRAGPRHAAVVNKSSKERREEQYYWSLDTFGRPRHLVQLDFLQALVPHPCTSQELQVTVNKPNGMNVVIVLGQMKVKVGTYSGVGKQRDWVIGWERHT